MHIASQSKCQPGKPCLENDSHRAFLPLPIMCHMQPKRYPMQVQEESSKNAGIQSVTTHHLSAMPSPLAVSLLGGGDVVPLPRREPSFASRSRKSDQSSANDSLLLELLAMSIGSLMLLFSEGVDGVRRNGDMGMRRLLFDAPGRARPACSRCSITRQ